MKTLFRLSIVGAVTVFLAGCASVSIDDALRDGNAATAQFTGGKVTLGRTPAEREARAKLAARLLNKPLSQDDAVQLALANSPELQALIAQSWNDMALASQRGRLPNPLFTFDRMRLGNSLELDRLLSVGLLDLLFLPQRVAIAHNEIAQARLQLTGALIDQVTRVRQTWVSAVAAQQLLQYAQQVNESAQASAELARRMQRVGNFSSLERARQQVFYADATTRLALASNAVTASREALVRALGLDDAQAGRLRLPERLPDLPKAPRDAREVSTTANAQRLDVQLARARVDAAGRSQGLNLVSSFVDANVGARHDTVFDTGQRNTRNGYQIDIRLPLFDWGSARRDALNAQTLALVNRYDATVVAAASQLRESYSSYRTAYDIARHYRDDIVPLRQTMADENMLRYNGMLIGVFELLAEARSQIASVTAAIDAQQQFWLADAALAASLTGRPTATAGAMAQPTADGSAAP